MIKKILTIAVFFYCVGFGFEQNAFPSDPVIVASTLVMGCDETIHPAEPEMVFVQGGKFLMGCTDEQIECGRDELPVREIEINSFHISIYLVTQGQWNSLMQNNPSNFTRGKNYPVENVSWNDVQEFIKRLNAATGKQYRLPTEAEWEYAARGGQKSRGFKYSGSNDVNEVAWFWSNSGNSSQPVGMKLPNELGIYDMSGNVAEWTNDVYTSYYDTENPNNSNSNYVLRGGRWSVSSRLCRVSSRDNAPPTYRHSDTGFRLVHP